MDDVFVYGTELPDGIDEMVVPCLDGYTVYIENRLGHNERLKALNHAMMHIYRRDHGKGDIQEIEYSIRGVS